MSSETDEKPAMTPELTEWSGVKAFVRAMAELIKADPRVTLGGDALRQLVATLGTLVDDIESEQLLSASMAKVRDLAANAAREARAEVERLIAEVERLKAWQEKTVAFLQYVRDECDDKPYPRIAVNLLIEVPR